MATTTRPAGASGVSVSTDDPEPIAQKAEAGSSSGASPADHQHPGPGAAVIGNPAASTRYVMPGWVGGGSVNNSPAAGSLYYTPIFVGRTTTYDRIGVYVATAQPGALARVGIYSPSAAAGVLVPGALVLDAGQLDLSGVGNEENVISQELTPGYWFLAFVIDTGGVAIRGFDYAKAVSCPVSGSSSSLSGFAEGSVASVTGDQSADVAGGLTDPARTITGGAGMAAAHVRLREV